MCARALLRRIPCINSPPVLRPPPPPYLNPLLSHCVTPTCNSPLLLSSGAFDAPMMGVSDGLAVSLPPITMVFCCVDGGKAFASKSRDDAHQVRGGGEALTGVGGLTPGGWVGEPRAPSPLLRSLPPLPPLSCSPPCRPLPPPPLPLPPSTPAPLPLPPHLRRSRSFPLHGNIGHEAPQQPRSRWPCDASWG